jgi:YVTN family beta-propeller protein
VEFRILGPLEVLDEGRELPLGPAKERAVLGVLLLHAGDVVSRTQLIDGLWGDSPPATAAKAVNVYVSQVRRTLSRNGGEPIVTRPPGYVLDLDAEALDAARFQRLATAAREREQAGELEAAAALMREAIRLWRGPAMAGLELEGAALNDLARLEELRFAAELDLVDYQLALGEHERLVPELERLVAQHPLDERLRGQLILALYRSGRQADALQAYRETRETLVETLGIEPSAPLQRLERAILNHDPALELPEGIPRPPAGSRDRRDRRPRRLAVGSALAVAAIVAAAVLLAARNGGGGPLVPPNSVAVIDPGTNKVVASIHVGIDPGPVAVGAGSVWVGNLADRTLSRIDPRTRTVTRYVSLAGTPTGVAAVGHAVWVAYGRLGSLARIEPEFENVDEPLRVSGRAYGWASGDGSVAVGPEGVWGAFGDSTVARISPDGTRVLSKGYAGSRPSAIALGEGAVWVANAGSNTVSEVGLRTARQIAAVNVALNPRGVAVAAGAVWVSAFGGDSVSRVQGSSSRTIAVGRGPLGIAGGAGSVWVANSRAGTVSRIDPQHGRVLATIHIGHHPDGIAVGSGAVWVTVQGD